MKKEEPSIGSVRGNPSREPIYGLGEWAVRYAPDLLGLTEEEIKLLNDDCVGRALDTFGGRRHRDIFRRADASDCAD